MIGERGLPSLAVQQVFLVDGTAQDLVPTNNAVVLTPAGDVAIGQRQDGQVVRFGKEGQRVVSFGRPGNGPGEFQTITRLGVHGDTVWVWDGATRRLTLLDPAWELAGVVPFQFGMAVDVATGRSFPNAMPVGFRRDSTVIAYLSDSDSAAVGLMDAEGHLVRPTVRLVAPGEIPKVQTEIVVTSATPFPISALFRASPSSEYIVIVRTALNERSLSVTLLSGGLDTLVVSAHQFRSRAIPARVLDSVLRVRTRLFPEAVAAEYRRQAVVPEVLPPVMDALVGDDGTVCLVLQDIGVARRLVMMTADGALVGEIALPWVERPVAVAQDVLITVRRGEDDVESIVKYRILPSGGDYEAASRNEARRATTAK